MSSLVISFHQWRIKTLLSNVERPPKEKVNNGGVVLLRPRQRGLGYSGMRGKDQKCHLECAIVTVEIPNQMFLVGGRDRWRIFVPWSPNGQEFAKSWKKSATRRKVVASRVLLLPSIRATCSSTRLVIFPLHPQHGAWSFFSRRWGWLNIKY